jgi:hypothetical protein
MTRRAPIYLSQPGDGEGLMLRQASIICIWGRQSGGSAFQIALPVDEAVS